MRNLALLLFLVLAISSCKQEKYDLGGFSVNYNSRLDKNVIVDNPEGATLNFYDKDSAFTQKYFRNTAIIIDAYIAEAIADSSFIVVDQKPMDSICECNQKCLQNKYANWNDLPTYKMCEEGIKKSKIHLFYIIDKKRNFLFGPMSKKMYFLKRKELNISRSLKLQIENK